MYQAIIAGAICLWATFASAQTLPTIQREIPGAPPGGPVVGLRALGDADEVAEWSAIGRLDTGQSFCSATLIAPDLVLTAAHCLYHPVTNLAFRPDDLRFFAGLHNGRFAALRRVRNMVVLPEYWPTAGENFEMISLDLALLELEHAIPPQQVRPIPTGQTGRTREQVTVVSYGANRATYASIEEGCRILAQRGTVRSLSCEVTNGSSGAPVLRIVDGQPQVVAVMSAIGQSDGESISFAVILDEQLEMLMDMHGRRQGFVTGGATANFLGAGDDGRSTIGARFVRP